MYQSAGTDGVVAEALVELAASVGEPLDVVLFEVVAATTWVGADAAVSAADAAAHPDGSVADDVMVAAGEEPDAGDDA